VKQTTNTHSSLNVTLQSWLRPALTAVRSNLDYERYRAELEQISAALGRGLIEAKAISYAIEALPEDSSVATRRKAAEFAVFAFRAELLRHLLNLPSFRAYSRMLASSDLLADFCGILTIEGIKWSSKSTLDRASKFFSAEQMADLNEHLNQLVSKQASSGQVGLDEVVDFSVCLVDSTCFEANIHFPTDWLLLKDVAHNLLKALILIRAEGLLCRMDQCPEQWITQMNRLCIQMTHARRRTDAKKQRKAVLRRMKRVLKRLSGHVRRHRVKLATCDLDQVKWSQLEVSNLLARIDAKLELLPKAIEQAHERIIGERRVASKDKVLSAHEGDLHVIVRGKAGKEVEFGNTLFVAETQGGFICDYQLYQERAPGDAKELVASLERIESYQLGQSIKEVVGDRGFDSKAVNQALESKAIENSICPKNPQLLEQKLSQPQFRKSQKRRGGTEARIAILTNNGGRVCRAKGFEHRSEQIGWGVLAHNMHWIARKVRNQRKDDQKKAA
jgi:hypothetical protein